MRDIKYFKLELIDDVLIKVMHNRMDNLKLFVFDYEDISKVKKINQNDFENGIYFISEKNSHDKLYIGQTTHGENRFNSHEFIKKSSRKCKIFFFDIEPNRAPKNVLDYIEKEMIKEVGYEYVANKSKGNDSYISNQDQDYATHASNAIKDFMKLFDFNLIKDENEEIGNELFFNEKENSISFRNRHDVVNALTDSILPWDGSKMTLKDIRKKVALYFSEDLENGRWSSEENLWAKVRQQYQIYGDGFERSIDNEDEFLFKAHRKPGEKKAYALSLREFKKQQ